MRLFFFFCFFWIVSCSPKQLVHKLFGSYHEVVSGETLTEESVLKYIKTVKRLHKMGREIPQKLAQKEGIHSADPIYKEIESIVTEEGFTNLHQFIIVNAKIAWAWNVSQGEIGMARFRSLQDDSQKMLTNAINDPNTPPEVKQELEKALKENQENWEKNKKYADFTLNLVKPLTNSHDLAIIQKYQKELMEAYTGIEYSQLKEIDPKFFIAE
jgi:hypothetical protein